MKFLIDFENVANNGFDGLGELRPSDELLIFYSEQHSTISITVHQALEKSLVHKNYMPVKTGGKNALDFQLVTWLGHEISQNPKEQFVIVSKDTGFDVVVDFWQKRGISLVRSRSLKGTKSILKKMKNILPEHAEEAEESSLAKSKLGGVETSDDAPKKGPKEESKEKKSRDSKKKKNEKNKKKESDESMIPDSPEETESKPTRRRRKSGKRKQQKTEDKSDRRENEKQNPEKPSKRKSSKKQEDASDGDGKEEKQKKQKRRRGSRRGRRKKSNTSDVQLSE